MPRRPLSSREARRREYSACDAGEDDGNAERLGEDDFAQGFARGRLKELRIVQPFGQVVGIENDRGDPDWPGQWAPPDLVDARNPTMAKSESLALEVEMKRRRLR